MADQHYGVIIRKDGTIPFDKDLDTVHRQRMIEGLKEQGHDVYYDPESNQHKIRDFKPEGSQ